MFCFLTLQALGQLSNHNGADVLHYEFGIKIYDTTDVISGKTNIVVLNNKTSQKNEITIDLAQKKQSDIYGMSIDSVFVNNRKVNYQFQANQVLIALNNSSISIEDTFSIQISYHGIPAEGLIIGENKFGSRTFFGDNWPNRAHNWLPVVDHPSDKATCEFIVEAPNRYDVIANGLLQKITQVNPERRVTHWLTKIPIPTKVMVIGAAEFAIQRQDTIAGVEISSWVFPENKAAGFHDYSMAPKVFKFFSKKLGPYPFEKLAHVQSKTRYGGMENAGNIFYSENSVTGKQKIELLIAHETAHQWFGNSLSEQSWHHLWLSEGFATYLTQLYVEATYGRDEMRANMATQKKKIIGFADRNPTASIIPTEINNLDELLNTNSYEKGGWFLHMLRHRVGDELFWKIIAEFYQTHALSNAATNDLLEVSNRVTKDDLTTFFHQWLNKPGIPRILYSWKYFKDRQETHLHLVQQGSHVYDLTIDLSTHFSKDDRVVSEINFDEKESTFIIKTDRKPTSIKFDMDGWLLAEFQKK